MNAIFVLLFLVTVGLLILGVISPKSLSKFSKKPLTRKDAFLSLGFFALLFAILTGMTAPQQHSNTTQKSGLDDISSVEPSEGQHQKAPVITTQTITETETIPFDSQTVQSASLDKGVTKITTPGVNGVKTLTYKVTYEDGVETDRALVSEKITTPPITQITTVGTKVAAPKPAPSSSNCDPNYSGACVPIASDVDCAGGNGNGPAYVRGPVTVIGHDIYDLDRDGNGIGCE